MFICGMVLSANSNGRRVLRGGREFLIKLLTLTQQMRWHHGEDVFEHRAWIQARSVGHGAGALCLLPAIGHMCLKFPDQLLVALLRPLAEADQMLFETLDGISQGPGLPVILGPVARRIVAGGVRRG